MRKLVALLIAIILFFFITANTSWSLTITGNYIGGDEPSTLAGGGTLMDIVNAAADYWENLIYDEDSYTFNYGWSDLGESKLAVTDTLFTPTIEFNNNNDNFFADSTPFLNEEYYYGWEEWDVMDDWVRVLSGDFSDSVLVGNTGIRLYSDIYSDANGKYDLLTVALHEIGHVLGLNPSLLLNTDFYDGNISLIRDYAIGSIAIDVPIVYDYPLLEPATGFHIDHYNALMYGLICAPGERKLITGVDRDVIMQINGYSNWGPGNLTYDWEESIGTIPEPSTMLLLVSSLVGIVRIRRKL